MTDEQSMRRAIELAKRGMGYTSPNPMVGAVIVKGRQDNRRGLAREIRRAARGKKCVKALQGIATGSGYVCDSRALLSSWQAATVCGGSDRSRYKKKYVGSDDPNPLVAGGGIKILKEHGIEVVTQVLKDECDRLNDVFFLLYTDQTSIRRDEICHDHGRKDSHIFRAFKVDNRRKSERTCAKPAPQI